MGKISISGAKAREKAIKGMNYVANVVLNTVGPFGTNSRLEKQGRITNDGFTISKELAPSIKDEFERQGALILHEACAKTNDQVGDATSTTEALVQAIVNDVDKLTGGFGGMKPSVISQMIEKEKNEVIEKMQVNVKMIETEEELINSAKVSVEDEELAKLIGSKQWELGKDGIILVEETNNVVSSIESIKGIKFDNGLAASVMMNNPAKQTLELPLPGTDGNLIIYTNYVLQDLKPIQTLLENLFKSGKNDIVIIARAFGQDAIRSILELHQAQPPQKPARIWAINAPYTNQREIMKDLQATIGGRYIDNEEGKLEDIQPLDVGFAKKIIVSRWNTIITGEDNILSKASIDQRVKKLQEELKGSESDFEKRALELRINQLNNGFAVLKVGAETDIKRKYKKDKADDAVQAVRLAFQGGTLKGGGLAFKEIANTMPTESILKKPLACIYEHIIKSAPEGFTIGDEIRDPFLVLKAALVNAVSVASVFITIDSIVCEENVKICSCSKNSNEIEIDTEI